MPYAALDQPRPRRTRRPARVLGAIAALAVALAACGDDDDASDSNGTQEPAVTEAAPTTEPSATTAASEPPATAAETTLPTESTQPTEETSAEGAAGGWTVDTEACIDPDRANAPIEGTVKIGSSGPLSGGPAAAAFAPVIAGMQAYIDYANENGLLPDHQIELTYGDDQFDPALTPGVINSALDNGAHLVSGLIGAANNMAVRDTLNEECIPQLLAGGGDPRLDNPAEYPWTNSGILRFDIEAKAYAEDLGRTFPDGATAAVYHLNNDAGAALSAVFEEAAPAHGIEIVDVQTVEAGDTNPPTTQLSSIASHAPDVIVAAPLGAQCPVFLNELANQKAANPGWEPRLYLVSVCASSLILGAAGDSANGLYTALPTGAVDVVNPETHTIPGVAEYLGYLESKGLSNTVPTSTAGWIWGEVTVEILRQAAESPDGLTQASIINAARNFEFTPSIVQDGFVYKASGDEDGSYIESVQLVRYDAGSKFFNPEGELITTFESS
jgi:ABC-type branched-subunit amino acid transport system substrate-binding protein